MRHVPWFNPVESHSDLGTTSGSLVEISRVGHALGLWDRRLISVDIADGRLVRTAIPVLALLTTRSPNTKEPANADSAYLLVECASSSLTFRRKFEARYLITGLSLRLDFGLHSNGHFLLGDVSIDSTALLAS